MKFKTKYALQLDYNLKLKHHLDEANLRIGKLKTERDDFAAQANQYLDQRDLAYKDRNEAERENIALTEELAEWQERAFAAETVADIERKAWRRVLARTTLFRD